MYYNQDLAVIHDTGFSAMAEAAATQALDLIRRSGMQYAVVVDLGCGSGTFARHVAAEGHRVVGVDYSENMVRIAREQVPAAEFHQGSFLDFALPPCNVVTAIGEVFNYLFDEKNSLDALEGVFRNIYAALHPGGILMFDSIESGILGASPQSRRIIENDAWTLFLDYSEDRAAGTLERRIVIFRKEGGSELYAKSVEVHRLNLYDRQLIRDRLLSVGFSEVTTLERYANLQLRDKNYVVVAVK